MLFVLLHIISTTENFKNKKSDAIIVGHKRKHTEVFARKKRNKRKNKNTKKRKKIIRTLIKIDNA